MSMKTARYFSLDLRSAVLAVRDELGSNAVILSHYKPEHGVQVIAPTEEAHQVKAFLPLVHNPQQTSGSAAHGRAERTHLSIDCYHQSKRTYFFKTGTGAQNANINQARLSNGNDSCTNQHQSQSWLGVGDVTANDALELMPELAAKHDSPYSPTISKSKMNS